MIIKDPHLIPRMNLARKGSVECFIHYNQQMLVV